MPQQSKEELQSILAGHHQGAIFRSGLFNPARSHFPQHPWLTSIAFKPIPVSLNEQGFAAWRHAQTEFIFEPPTGAFQFSSPIAGTFSGTLQTGEFEPACFFLELAEGDEVYGFGAANGSFERSNSQFSLLNLDTHCYSIPGSSYSSFPFFMLRREGRFIGILWNCSLPARARIKSSSSRGERGGISISPLQENQAISQEFICFPGNPATILQNYALLTGRPFMPPLWSLGYHQSRWSYRSSKAVLAVAERLRREAIPCDAIHLDIHYMKRYRIFTWHPRRFPQPGELHRQLGAMGFHTAAVVDPGVAAQKSYSTYREGRERGYFCKTSKGEDFIGKLWPGSVAYPDFFQEKVRIWWGRLHTALFEAGVSGIWNDMNDPGLKLSRYNPLKADMWHTVDKQLRHHSQMRNLYANLEAEAAHRAFDLHPQKLRPWILTRSAFCGMQRYAAIWTGDNCTSWRDLKEHLNMVVNLSLSGMPFCGADVGGFGGNRLLPSFLRLFKWIKRRRLFSRWIELGSLMPFFRIHTVLFSHSQEPWSFGRKVLNNCRYHIQRRYRLLPYLYSLAYRSHCTGAAMLRPLFYNYPEIDPRQGEDQFMLGSDLLAAPVFSPRAKRRRLYLPPGEWYEYESGRSYLGSNLYDFSVGEGYYPLFVRAGAVLPTCTARINSRESLAEGLTLEIYPYSRLQGELYLDDGSSSSFKGGKFTEMRFSGYRDQNLDLYFSIEALLFQYRPPLIDRLELRLFGDYPTMLEGAGKSKGRLKGRKKAEGASKPQEEGGLQVEERGGLRVEEKIGVEYIKKREGSLSNLRLEGRNLLCYRFEIPFQAGAYKFLHAAPPAAPPAASPAAPYTAPRASWSGETAGDAPV